MGDDFSTLFEFLAIGAYRMCLGGELLRVNPALLRLNGYASEDEARQGVREAGADWYVQPGRRAEFMRRLDLTGQVVGLESEIVRHKSRERIWVSENAHAVRGAGGGVLFYEGTVEDITERVVAREALAHSREELRQIVDLVPGMVYRVVILPDGQRQATFVSPGVHQLLELGPAEVLSDGLLMYRLTHADDRAHFEAATAAAALARAPLQLEYRVQLASGREKWLQMLSASAPAQDGHDVRVGLVFDITARRQAEAALHDNNQLWKRALESTGDGVWDWHVQAGVEIFSPQCRALYGYTDDELPDRPDALDTLTHPDDVARMHADRDAHFKGHTPRYVNEHRVRCKDGQWKWILSRGIVIQRDEAGAPLRMIGTHTDITASKQAQALRHERDRAAAADLAKSQFLSRVSHELRTPLNAVLGFAQLLERQPGDGERQLGWIRHVLASGRHLLALMDDILDLSSLQTGHVTLNTEAVALGPVVAEAWTMLAAAAQAQAVVLIDEVPVGDACLLRADRRRLKQIVINLLSNAIKYNRPGGWVRMGVLRHEGTLEINVADNGHGMDAEQQARLFNPFDRLGAERSAVAGTGLGLALSRQLAEAMGGSIGVRSRAGVGSTFSVRLPSA